MIVWLKFNMYPGIIMNPRCNWIPVGAVANRPGLLFGFETHKAA